MSPFTSLSARRGFTLIELIAVIVILAILAVVAVPAMLDLRRDARDATVRSVAGSLRTGIDSARLRWRIGGGGIAVNDLSGWADGTADFSADGFLMGTNYAGGTVTHENCAEIWRAAFANGPTVSSTSLAGNGFYGNRLFTFCRYYLLDGAGGPVVPYITIDYDPTGLLGGGNGLMVLTDSSGTTTNLPAAN